MCIVSNIGDAFDQTFPKRWPMIPLPDVTPNTKPEPIDWSKLAIDGAKCVTRQEFDALKKELEEVKALIKAAQKFDATTQQPNCDSPDKLQLFRWLANAMGIDISDLKLNQ